MKFSSLMSAHWAIYKKAVSQFERGELSVTEFHLAHTTWHEQVQGFEKECSDSSNYGAW